MRRPPALIVAAALLLALYAWHVSHQAFLCDDAFISFRYAKNLADGEGLVWNPGERVEGYTNFLWVLVMSAVIKSGLSVEFLSQLLGFLSGVLVLATVLVFCVRRWGVENPIVWLIPLILVVSRSFAAWSTSGLETMFFTALVFAAAISFLDERENTSRRPWRSALLFALASLTRPEGLIFAVIAGAFFEIDVMRGRRSVRDFLLWSAVCVAPIGAHFLWRFAYYGYWLPNTFYAKVPGARLDQGFHHLRLFNTYYNVAWFVPLIALTLWRKRDATVFLFATFTAAYLAYVVAVGGDRFEFRFFVVIMPFLYVLLADGLAGLWRDASRNKVIRVAAAVAAVALLTTTLNALRVDVPRQARRGVARLEGVANYARSRIAQGKRLRAAIDDGRLPADIVLGAAGVGAVPYYTEWPTIDLHGLNDVEIAHLPIDTRDKAPGHERFAPIDYLWSRGVEILDADNLLVHDGVTAKRGLPLKYGGEVLPTRAFELDDGKYIIFATPLSDADLQARLPGMEIFEPKPSRAR